MVQILNSSSHNTSYLERKSVICLHGNDLTICFLKENMCFWFLQIIYVIHDKYFFLVINNRKNSELK